jgi:hypothetical protein
MLELLYWAKQAKNREYGVVSDINSLVLLMDHLH